jgi:hypothetical protein
MELVLIWTCQRDSFLYSDESNKQENIGPTGSCSQNICSRIRNAESRLISGTDLFVHLDIFERYMVQTSIGLPTAFAALFTIVPAISWLIKINK